MDGWRAGLAAAARDALGLLVPVACAGCGADGRELCPGCRLALDPADPVVREVEGLPVLSGLVYRDAVRRIILAAKDGRTVLLDALAPALTTALAGLGVTDGRVLVVPVPSSRAGYRRRGVDPVRRVLRAAGVPVAATLTRGTGTGEQKGLGLADRGRNRVDAFRVRRPVTGARVVVVDDVVTTGATVAAAAAVLRAAGAEVVGAATVAATPRHRGGPIRTIVP